MSIYLRVIAKKKKKKQNVLQQQTKSLFFFSQKNKIKQQLEKFIYKITNFFSMFYFLTNNHSKKIK